MDGDGDGAKSTSSSLMQITPEVSRSISRYV
jgi:hypothetical protein